LATIIGTSWEDDYVENNLRVLRAMRNITQEDLALNLGVTRQTILAIENGKYNPSLELAFKMAKYFETTIEKVFLYKEDADT
jgi:putative transcriptional regulator